jgi:hypothetical protein
MTNIFYDNPFIWKVAKLLMTTLSYQYCSTCYLFYDAIPPLFFLCILRALSLFFPFYFIFFLLFSSLNLIYDVFIGKQIRQKRI